MRTYASNEIAHYNQAKGTFADCLTLGDLHSSINLIVDLSVKYRNLILGSHMAKTVSMSHWLHAFQQPWIAEDNRLMEITGRARLLWGKRERGNRLRTASICWWTARLRFASWT